MAEGPDTTPGTATLTAGAGWLLQHLPLGVLLLDEQTRILDANETAQQLLGTPLEHLRGRPITELPWTLMNEHGDPLGQERLAVRRALDSGEVVSTVTGLHPAGGELRWLKVTAIPQPEQGQVYSVFEDVTASHTVRLNLRRSEARYRALVQATSQYVWTNSPDGRMEGEQPDWAALTGQTAGQYQGYGWADAVHPDDRLPTIERWEAAVATGSRFETEHRVRVTGGAYRHFAVRAVPLQDARGQVQEWVGLHTDITPLRDAEAALRALNARLEEQVEERTQAYVQLSRFNALLLDNAGEGIFGLDASGLARFANPAAAAMLGYTVDELTGQPMHALIHHHHPDGRAYPPEDCPVSQMIQHPLPSSRRVEGEVFWRKDGRALPVEYVVTALPPEAPGELGGGVVLLFQDVTVQQQARADLERAIVELERSNRELEQFAYVSSHDLQEPLRTVGSYADLLARRYQGQLDHRADQYLRFMQDAVTRMRQLINDLLSFSRIGRQDVQPHAVDLNRVMRDLQASLQVLLDESRATLTWDALPAVDGTEVLTGQLLGNVVSNALKFRRPDVPPVITVRGQVLNGQVHLSVQDNGIGIEPEFQERVFGLFQRLHRRDEYEGTGLGLAICRKIVQTLGGEIWLESHPGQGTTVHLRLPAPGTVTHAATPTATSAVTTPGASPSEPHRDPRDGIV